METCWIRDKPIVRSLQHNASSCIGEGDICGTDAAVTEAIGPEKCSCLDEVERVGRSPIWTHKGNGEVNNS